MKFDDIDVELIILHMSGQFDIAKSYNHTIHQITRSS